MTNTSDRCPIATKNIRFGTYISDGGDKTDVSKEDRKRRVLAFLVDSGMALPRKALFRNLKYQGADFSDSSLKNYLGELREDGLVERLDAEAFAKGSAIISDDDPGYWIATRDGVSAIESYRSEADDMIDTSHL